MTRPVYVKLDTLRRGLLRRVDLMVEVAWVDEDGSLALRRCWRDEVKVFGEAPDGEGMAYEALEMMAREGVNLSLHDEDVQGFVDVMNTQA